MSYVNNIHIWFCIYGDGWVFLISFYEEEERERVGEINILINKLDK